MSESSHSSDSEDEKSSIQESQSLANPDEVSKAEFQSGKEEDKKVEKIKRISIRDLKNGKSPQLRNPGRKKSELFQGSPARSSSLQHHHHHN